MGRSYALSVVSTRSLTPYADFTLLEIVIRVVVAGMFKTTILVASTTFVALVVSTP